MTIQRQYKISVSLYTYQCAGSIRWGIITDATKKIFIDEDILCQILDMYSLSRDASVAQFAVLMICDLHTST